MQSIAIKDRMADVLRDAARYQQAGKLTPFEIELAAALEEAKAQRDELLAALKEYRKAYGNCGSLYQQQAADMADAAIARAEGK